MALKDNLVSMKNGWPAGFQSLDTLPDSSQGTNPTTPSAPSPRMRTAVPATNADADLINQVGKGGSNPQFRMLPLPPATGSSTTIVESGGSSSSSSSGGGGSSSTFSLNPKTVTVSVPSLGAGSSSQMSVALSQSFQILSVSSNNACNVRLYGSAAAQVSDSVRSVDAPVPAELVQNIILDVVFDTVPYLWYCQNIIGANGLAPQSTLLYVTIINDTAGPISGTVITIVFVPLET
jgi:hypothetical protein